MSHSKTVFLLIGPKGTGKTYLAARMEEELAIQFLRVEPIWLNLSSEMPSNTPGFDHEGQLRVLSSARALLESSDSIVLESTGTAPWFSPFLGQLKELGRVVLIRLRVPLSICLKRIHSRDASQHIPVSDDRICEINDIADRLELPWSAVVENISSENADEFIESVHSGELR